MGRASKDEMVLNAIAAGYCYGLDIIKATGLSSGTLYPVLGRLEDQGLIVGKWETIDPSALGRPRRRYYEVTK